MLQPNQKARVFIGTPSSDYPSRNNGFFAAIESLKAPAGSTKKIFVGDPWSNIDAITEEAIKGRYTHVFFIDDDQTFDSNLLFNLLRHEKEVISGLYLLRHNPFPPALFVRTNELGQAHWLTLEGPPRVIEVERCGMGCLLVETSVFKKLTAPYYRMEIRNGLRFGCDILFCEDLKKAGFKIYADTNSVTEHAIKTTVRPRWNGKEWVTEFKANQGTITIDAFKEKEEEVLT